MALLLERFPSAKAIAARPVAEAIARQIEPDFVKSFWEPRFPGLLPKKFAAPQPATGDTFTLEGEELRIVPLGHTDTSHTTALHIPSRDLVIAGDAIYNETHLYLAECDAAARSEWLRALDIIEALQPKAVVAGHAVTDQDGSPRHIDATRRYIQDFNATVAKTANQLDLYNEMLALYPDRVNPGSLWGAAKAAKPAV